MGQHAQHMMLVGGGHAHVAVLADWITNGLPAARATLLTPHRHLRYSGMVPGWIAGQYEREDGLVDLAPLAKRAGVQLVLGRCTGIDPDARWIKTGGGQVLEYDVASLDTGGVGRARAMLDRGRGEPKDTRLIDVRPIDRFVDRIAALEDVRTVVVIGGGAAGVEIAFALRNRASQAAPSHVTLIAGKEGLLPGFASAIRRKVAAELGVQGIALVNEDASLTDGALTTKSGPIEDVDVIVAALGSGAPDWPKAGGLATDAHGFIAVDAYQRCVSHPDVFAVGDVASRQDHTVTHSGVHAVMAGPVLAQNLRSVLTGGKPRAIYKPRKASLYLISTGNGRAILSYGPLSAQGAWVAKLKASIDKRWISQYATLSR